MAQATASSGKCPNILHGHEEEHAHYRLMTTAYMAAHPVEFEAFLEDDETLVTHV